MSKPRYRVRAGSSAYTSARSYEGAGNGRRTSGWQASSGGPNSTLLPARHNLVRRSRDLVRQDPYAKTAIRVHVDQTVGDGIRAVCKSFPDLQEIWANWSKVCDPRGQLDFAGMQRLAYRSTLEGGDSFGRFRFRRLSDGLPVPLQIQLIEAEHCPSELTQPHSNGNSIVGGIEYDKVGRPVAYHMYREHPGDAILGRSDNGMTVRVPASEVMHLIDVGRPGQVRGEPLLAQALTRLYEFHRYEDAEIYRKLLAAYTSEVLYTTGTDEDAEVLGEDDDGDGTITADPMEPGTTRVLPPGYQRDVSAPADLGGSYESFVRRTLMAIASAAGVPYGSLSGDWSGMNDRTIRQVILEFRRHVGIMQRTLLIHQFCQPVWNAFVDAALMSGAYELPAGAAAEDLYSAVEWRVPAVPYLHPVQDIQSDQAAIRAGFKSRTQVIAERGGEIDRVMDEIAAENADADEKGLVFDSDPRRTTGSGIGQAARVHDSVEENYDAQLDDALDSGEGG